MADGSIKIETRIASEQAQKDLDVLNKIVDKSAGSLSDTMSQSIEKLNADWSRLESQQSRNNAKIDEYKSKISELSELSSLNLNSGEAGDQIIAEGQLKEISELKMRLQEAEAKADGINAAMTKVSMNANKTNSELQQGGISAKSLGNNLKNAEQGATKMSDSVGGGVKKLARYALALFSIRSIYGMLSKLANNWLNQNTAASRQVQADIKGMTNSISSLLGPVIQWLVGLAKTLMGYISGIAKAFFGVEIFSAATEENLGGAVGQAKKLKKEMAGFDEMNTIGSQDDSGGGGSGGSPIGAEIKPIDVTPIKEFVDKFLKEFQPFIDTIKSIDWEPMKKGLQKAWNSMKPILGTMGKSIKFIVNDLLGPLFKWLAEDLVPAGLNTFAGILDFIAPILNGVVEGSMFLWNNFLIPIASWTGGVIVSVLNDIGTGLTIIGNWMSKNEPIMKAVGTIITALGLGFLAWNAYLAITNGLLLTLRTLIMTNPLGLIVIGVTAIIAIIAILVANWDNIVKFFKDTITNIKKWFDEMGERFKRIFNDIGNKGKEIVEGIKNAWNSLGAWFKSVVIDPIARFFDGLWNGVKNSFSSAWNFITNTFSKGGQIFNGLKDGIVDAFKTIVNTLLDGVNRVIRVPFDLINGLLNNIRAISILGMKPFNGMWSYNPIPVPQIPKLAKGGIVSRPTQAIIGEAGREAVIPLENNTQGMKEIADMILAGMGGGTQQINLMLDGAIVNRQLLKKQSSTNLMLNGGTI